MRFDAAQNRRRASTRRKFGCGLVGATRSSHSAWGRTTAASSSTRCEGADRVSEKRGEIRVFPHPTLGFDPDAQPLTSQILQGGTDVEQAGKSSVLPSEQQLQQLQQLNLVPGRNSASFQVRELDTSTQSWEVKREMSCSIFLWGTHDSIVVVEHEGAVVKDDPWSKGAETISKARVVVSADLNPTSRVREDRGETNIHRAPIEEVSLVRDGAGALLSSISQAGFKLLFVTKAPISKVERVREGLQQVSSVEVKKWGQAASLPDAPIICGPDHTMAVITNRLSSKALSVAGKSGGSKVFPAAMLQQVKRCVWLSNIYLSVSVMRPACNAIPRSTTLHSLSQAYLGRSPQCILDQAM